MDFKAICRKHKGKLRNFAVIAVIAAGIAGMSGSAADFGGIRISRQAMPVFRLLDPHDIFNRAARKIKDSITPPRVPLLTTRQPE